MRSITVIAASAALALAAFAYAGAPPEETGPPQASPAQQPATSAPADEPTAPPADPSGSAQSSTATGSASGPDSTRLAALAPSGMSPQEACAGFQNSTDCAAVLHVAQNLNIPFADLKSKLAGGKKLDAAITEMKPDANAQAEVDKAVQQAREDASHAPSG